MKSLSFLSTVTSLFALCVVFTVHAESTSESEGARQSDQASSKPPQSALAVGNTLDGATGLLRVVSADSAEPGTLRLFVNGSFFAGEGFLCPDCERANGSISTDSDKAAYSAVRVQFAMTPLPFLEGHASLRFRSVSNDQSSPKVIQASGDTILGAKLFLPRRPGRIYSVGGGAALLLTAQDRSIGEISPSIDLHSEATLDLWELPQPKRLPLRGHLNLGYRFDNTATVADTIEDDRTASRGEPQRLTRIERFGYAINRTDFVRLGMGAEWLFKYVRPFAEWSIDVSTNRQGYKCLTDQVSVEDSCLEQSREFSALPSRLSLGARGVPYSNSGTEGLILLLALDIGTGGTSDFVEEMAPELPWALHVGVGYAIDTRRQSAPPTPVAQTPTPPPPPVLPVATYVQGTVVDQDSFTPLADASVRFQGLEYNAMLTDSQGRFRTINLDPGDYAFRITAAGYSDTECQATVNKPVPAPAAARSESSQARSEVTAIRCPMARLPNTTTVTGVLRDADTTRFIGRATVGATDNRGRRASLETDDVGGFRFENVPAGSLKVRVTADGYLPSATELTLEERQSVAIQLTLHKRPKQPNVTVSPKELRLRQPIRFLHDSGELVPNAQAIVEELSEVLLQHPELAQIEIQSHTDDSAPPDQSQTLSAQRANRVREELILLGIDPGRLVARGLGSSEPLVPNSNDTNRAKNDRLKLVITAQ